MKYKNAFRAHAMKNGDYSRLVHQERKKRKLEKSTIFVGSRK